MYSILLGRPHAQEYPTNTIPTERYLYEHFVSFCFPLAFLSCWRLPVCFGFSTFVFLGDWFVCCFLFVFVVFQMEKEGDREGEKERTLNWVAREVGKIWRSWKRGKMMKIYCMKSMVNKQINGRPLRTDI